jgi:hypothetical protein
MAYDREIVLTHVYGEVAAGRSLDRVLRDDADMPDPATFWRWHLQDETIRDNLARARENGVERLMGECVDIADETWNDTITDIAGNDKPNTEWISRSKLRIETRMKYAQMIAPRKYGPKLDVTSAGDKLDIAAIIAERRQQVAAGKAGDADEG